MEKVILKEGMGWVSGSYSITPKLPYIVTKYAIVTKRAANYPSGYYREYELKTELIPPQFFPLKARYTITQLIEPIKTERKGYFIEHPPEEEENIFLKVQKMNETEKLEYAINNLFDNFDIEYLRYFSLPLIHLELEKFHYTEKHKKFHIAYLIYNFEKKTEIHKKYVEKLLKKFDIFSAYISYKEENKNLLESKVIKHQNYYIPVHFIEEIKSLKYKSFLEYVQIPFNIVPIKRAIKCLFPDYKYFNYKEILLNLDKEYLQFEPRVLLIEKNKQHIDIYGDIPPEILSFVDKLKEIKNRRAKRKYLKNQQYDKNIEELINSILKHFEINLTYKMLYIKSDYLNKSIYTKLKRIKELVYPSLKKLNNHTATDSILALLLKEELYSVRYLTESDKEYLIKEIVCHANYLYNENKELNLIEIFNNELIKQALNLLNAEISIEKTQYLITKLVFKTKNNEYAIYIPEQYTNVIIYTFDKDNNDFVVNQVSCENKKNLILFFPESYCSSPVNKAFIVTPSAILDISKKVGGVRFLFDSDPYYGKRVKTNKGYEIKENFVKQVLKEVQYHEKL